MLGIFGCNFFLLSANFGTLDKVADDGEGSGKARAISVIACDYGGDGSGCFLRMERQGYVLCCDVACDAHPGAARILL